MSGKRARRQQKGESSSNKEFDLHKFRSLVNKKRVNEIESRDFIKERGFDLKEGEHPDIQNHTRELGWELLCLPASRFCHNVVHEFYANAFRVCGKKFNCS